MTDTKRDGGPAYPFSYDAPHSMGYPGQTELVAHAGMSLRQWYAGMALMGLLAGTEQEHCSDEMTPEEVDAWRLSVRERDANWCFQMADAMLARSQEGDG